MQKGTFSRKITAEKEEERTYDRAVNEIWNFDANHNGVLDKEETRKFISQVLVNFKGYENLDDAKFETTFNEIDTNRDSMVDKAEMKVFLKMLMTAEKAQMIANGIFIK